MIRENLGHLLAEFLYYVLRVLLTLVLLLFM